MQLLSNKRGIYKSNLENLLKLFPSFSAPLFFPINLVTFTRCPWWQFVHRYGVDEGQSGGQQSRNLWTLGLLVAEGKFKEQFNLDCAASDSLHIDAARNGVLEWNHILGWYDHVFAITDDQRRCQWNPVSENWRNEMRKVRILKWANQHWSGTHNTYLSQFDRVQFNVVQN